MSSVFRHHDGLTSQVSELWDASLCNSTLQVYKTGISCFINFLSMNQLVKGRRLIDSRAYPHVTEEHLVYFVTHCKNVLRLKHDTIQLYLAGIRYHYLRYNQYDPLQSSAQLDYILRGVKKLQSNLSKKRMPITASVLSQMCTLLGKGLFTPFIDSMLLCAFKLAFFGFLRCGEFTYNGPSKSAAILAIRDISIHSSGSYFSVFLQSSKCDPFNKGVEIKIFENANFQPVKEMSQYLQLRLRSRAVSTSPLFIKDEFEPVPLSRNIFVNYLKEICRRLGFDESAYSGHSFRIGAASSAAAAGVEDHIIKVLGRWSSDCYTRYIRIDQKIIEMAQNDMCQ